jgi:hypothetical protein
MKINFNTKYRDIYLNINLRLVSSGGAWKAADSVSQAMGDND